MRLCGIDDIPDGHSQGFDPLGEGRDTMFAVRRGPRVYGWRNACPHQDYARMAWKKDEFLNGDRTYVMCSAHGALFGIEDGICVIGPCLGKRLAPVPLAVRNGEVHLTARFDRGLRSRRR